MQSTQAFQDNPSPIATVRLQDAAKAAWDGKWYLIGCVLASLLLGTGYLMKTEPIYKVGARLLVQQQRSPLERGISARADKDFLATQAEIIRSPAVVQQAAASLEGLTGGGQDTSEVMSILSTLRVNPLTGTNVLSIGFRGRNSEQAVHTVNAVIDSYKKYLQEMDRDSNLQSLGLLTQNEKILRKDLEELEAHYRKVRKDSPLMGQGNQAAAVQRSLLENLGMAVSETRNRRIELENQLRVVNQSRAHVATAKKDAVITVVSAPGQQLNTTSQTNSDLIDWGGTLVPNMRIEGFENLKSFHEQLTLAEVRQQTLAGQFGEKHPEIKAVREEINTWRQLLRKVTENAPKVLERDLATIKLQEQRLADLYQSEFDQAKLLDGHLLEEQQALDGIERVQLIHDSILTQLRELQLADQALVNGRSVVKVSVLEGPSLAQSPIWPQKSVLLGGCAAAGLMAGMGLIVSFGRTATSAARSSESWKGSTGSAVAV